MRGTFRPFFRSGRGLMGLRQEDPVRAASARAATLVASTPEKGEVPQSISSPPIWLRRW